jgi:hypothetical protein
MIHKYRPRLAHDETLLDLMLGPNEGLGVVVGVGVVAVVTNTSSSPSPAVPNATNS